MDISLTNMLKGARQYFQGLPTASNANLINSLNTESIYSNNEKHNLLQLDNRKHQMDVNYQNHHQQTTPIITTASSTSSSYWPSTDPSSSAIHQHHHQPQQQQYQQTQYHQNLPNHSYTSSSNSLYNFQKITYADSIAATPVTVPHPKHNSPVTYHELQSIKSNLQQQQQLPQTQNQQQINHYGSYPNTNTSKMFYTQDFSNQQFSYNQHQRDFITQSIVEKSSNNGPNTTVLLNPQHNYTNVPNIRSQSSTNQRQHYYQQQFQQSQRQETQMHTVNQQSENFNSRNSYQNMYAENRDYLPSIQSPAVPMSYFTQNHSNNTRLPENYNHHRKSEQYNHQQPQSERREKTETRNCEKNFQSLSLITVPTSQQLQLKQQDSLELSNQTVTLKKDFGQKLNKRESPLDLSVKTIRTSADSTAVVDDGENYNNSTFNAFENSKNNSITSYDTLNTYRSLDSYPSSGSNTVKSQNDNMKAPFNKYQQLFQQQQRSFHASTNTKNANVNEWLQSQQKLVDKVQYEHQQSLKQQCFQQQQPPPPPQQHPSIPTVPKKRPFDNVTSSNNKVPKMENWLQAIDQQIEQKFSSYAKKKEEIAMESNKMKSMDSDSLQGTNTSPISQMCNSFTGEHVNDEQLSKTKDQFEDYNSSVVLNKKVLNLLRNSLETKEAQKKFEQTQKKNLPQQQSEQQIPVLKTSGIGRHNLSPFTAASLLERNNSPVMNKSHNFQSQQVISTSTNITNNNNNRQESIAYFDSIDQSDKKLLNQFCEQVGLNQSNLSNNVPDIDGLAAFLAVRIRTKGELKQLGPMQIQRQQKETFQKKLSKDSPTRKRLLSSGDDMPMNINMSVDMSCDLPSLKRTDNSIRRTSETSVFDFHESDSENETHHSLKPTLRKDRKKLPPSSTPKNSMKSISDHEIVHQLQEKNQHNRHKDPNKQLPTNHNKGDVKPMSIENKCTDNLLDSVCNKFVQKLKSGGGKKRGRRKPDQDQRQLAHQKFSTEKSFLKQKTKTNNNEFDSDSSENFSPNKTNQSLLMCSTIKSEMSISNNNSAEKSNKNLVETLRTEFKDIIYYPGWETELFNYKKSLRMPSQLINLKRPSHWPKISVSLPDLDPYPNSPCSSLSVTTDNPSEITNISEKFDEPIGESTPLPKKCNSIIEILAERYGKLKQLPKLDSNLSKLRTIKKSIKLFKNLPEVLPTPFVNNYHECYLTKLNQRQQQKHQQEQGNSNSGSSGNSNVIDNDELFSENISKWSLSPNSKIFRTSASFQEIFGDNRPASAPPYLSLDINQELKKTSFCELKQIFDKFQNKKKTLNIVTNKKQLKFDYLQSKKFLYFYSLLDKSDSCMEQITNVTQANDLLLQSLDTSQNEDGKKLFKSNKKVKLRRKLSSGFDYIRKKKKQITNSSKFESTKIKKRDNTFHSYCVSDISKELKSWVLNKGVGETYLHRASRLGRMDVVAYCLEKMEMNPSVKDNAGYTPLHEACARGYLDVAKSLLLYRANVTEAAQGGIRPLHEAAENGCVEIVRLLLSYGADMLLATYSGQTPLSLATDESVICLLKNHLLDIQGQSTSRWCFSSPSSNLESENNGYNALQTPLILPNNNDYSEKNIGIEIEISGQPLPNTYYFKNDENRDKWMILNDLLESVKMKTKDGLLRQINYLRVQNNNNKLSDTEIIQEIKTRDFLENVDCNQIFCAGEKVNLKYPKITLVKCIDEIDQLLCIEKFLMPDR